MFADRPIQSRDEGFSALLESKPLALLHVGTNRLLEHFLQLIAATEAPRPQIDLFVSREIPAIRELVGDGARWGLDVTTHLTTGTESQATLLRRIAPATPREESLLILEVLGLPDLDPAALLQEQQHSLCYTDERGRPVTARFLHRETGLEDLSSLEEWPTRALPGHFSKLDSTPSYHRANLRFCSADVRHLVVPGQEIAVGVRSGRQSRVELSSLQNVPVLIGSRCRINRGAEILGSVVLSDASLVDRGAQLQNAVILPNTYVGELTAIRDAVVSGDLLIHLDTCVPVRVTDAFLLSDLSRSGLANTVENFAHRAVAALLALLSLPLFLLGLLWASLTRPGAPLERDLLLSNRREPSGDRSHFLLTRLHGCGLLLGALPPLLAVVRGHLRLVGVSPQRPDSVPADPEPWQELHLASEAGLLGPTQLQLSDTTSLEERTLSDAIYASHRTWWSDIGWLLTGLRHLFGGWAPVAESATPDAAPLNSSRQDPAATPS